MSFVTSIVSVAPLRAEAAHRSEMVSQFLFGEVAKLLETTKDFSRIKTLFDDYTGWCQNSQLAAITDEKALNGNKLLNADLFSAITCNGAAMQIPFGTPLHFFEKGEARIGNFEFGYSGKIWTPEETHFNEATIKWVADHFMNTSYLWGGRTIMGIDCSGFTQQVFRFLGINLPRDAYQQAILGEAVGFLQEARCGDLAFFDNQEEKITHVGLMLDTETIMHASGKVRIDRIDNMGIINSDTGERTHRLRLLKRYHL
ncbi:MAG: C40 family peptidase [Chitinophagaceae bacterium]|nr:C40 family peptidase [Chitinophagaceae bacterium]